MASNKRKIMVCIDQALEEELRKFLARKYGKYEKGLLSHEVELAIRNWLSLHTKAHEAISIPNPPFKLAQKWNSVKNYFTAKNLPLVTGVQVSRMELMEAISQVIGADKRTIRKYLALFQQFKLVKHIAGDVFEIL